MFHDKPFLGAVIAIASFVLSLGLLSTEARAQETSANISGTVVDANGAVVPGAKIKVINDSLGLQREASSNQDGYYVVPLLPAGRYTLVAEMPGFATVSVTGIVLQVSINSSVDITFQPKTVVESVNVAADGNQINTTDATVKYSVSNEQVRGLPVMTGLVGRTVLSVLPFLVPGVTPTDTFGSIGTGNRRGESMSINGNRTLSISYNFEGGDNNDSELNLASSPFPNPDALQELTVVTNNYQADLGRSSGGVINAVTKTGTNSFHGNARYYRIHESLNARSFFDRVRRLNRVDTFGGQIGGPIVRNRTNFFIDYEGTRSNRVSESRFTVLTNQERAGDFSNLPVAFQPLDPTTGQPFPGGKIPDARINPISRTYINKYIPVPNDGNSNLVMPAGLNLVNDQLTLRIDHRIGKKDTVSGTYFYTASEITGNGQNLPIGSSFRSPSTNQNYILRETHLFSTRSVNQLTFTVTRYVQTDQNSLGKDADILPREIGFTGVRPQTERFAGIPEIEIDNGTAIGNVGTPGIRAKTTWQIKDDLSHSRGDQTIKLGGEVRSFIFNNTVGNNNGGFGFYGFNSVGTGSGVADFLLGLPFYYFQTTGFTAYPRQRSYSFYAQDDLRVRPNLTINLGLRYELTPPLRDELDQVSVFRPGQRSERVPNAPVGVLFAGDIDPILGTVPRAGYPTDKNNLAPRVGIAYSPRPRSGWFRSLFGEAKSSIRAGWGVFYDQTYGFNLSRFQFIEPFSVFQFLLDEIGPAGGTFANPFGSLPNPWPLDLGERVFTATPALNPYDPSFRTAYTYQYNLSFQRELPGSLLMELAYVGSNTFKAERERELNLATVGPGATIDNVQSRRIYPQFSTIPNHESSGRARYDSFQVRLTRRFRRGLAFDGSYVLSKGLDNGSSPLGTGSTFVVGAAPSRAYPFEWARSAFDRRHNFVVSYTYDFPVTKRGGLVGGVLNGWQIGGITQFRSGSPMEITQFADSTLTARTAQGNPDLIGPYRRLDPRQRQTIIVNGVPQTGNFFFDPSAFRVVNPSQARAGTLARNVFDGPGVNQWAASIIKSTSISEAHRIEIRADINNLFNHAQFFTPETFVDFSDFGRVSSAAPGRTVQLSVRYSF
jgi:hypothetical protein